MLARYCTAGTRVPGYSDKCTGTAVYGYSIPGTVPPSVAAHLGENGIKHNRTTVRRTVATVALSLNSTTGNLGRPAAMSTPQEAPMSHPR